MTKSNKKATENVANDAPQEKGALNLGNLKLNRKVIVILSTVVVIAGLFIGFKFLYLDPKEEKAQAQLTEAEQLIDNQAMAQLDQILNEIARAEAELEQKGDTAPAGLNDSIKQKTAAYEKAKADIYNKALKGDGKTPGLLKIADMGMTSAANIAKAQAGICYYKLGNYKEAIKMLENFTPQGDKGVSPQFIAALANCYAADGQLDKAIDTFKKAASEADNAATSPQYLIEAGLLLESQKKNDEALKIYEQIKKDYPQAAIVAPQQMQGGYVSGIDKYIERVSK